MSDEKRSEDGHDEPTRAGLPGSETAEGSDASTSADPPAKAEAAEPAEAKPAEDAASVEPADEEEDEEEAEDAANPAAIARRVAALGADDRDEAFAREEERKLAERRAAGKKKTGKKKVGLEAAASKKLGKIGTRAEPKRTVAVASDADPLIAQTTKISDWAKKNQKTVQGVGLVVVAALLGAAGFLYYDHKRESEASQGLAKAVETQGAKIGEAPKSEDDEPSRETYYKTFADRQNAALAQYRDLASKFPRTGAAILARLAEGSLLLDKRDADGALAAFNDVKGSALAAADIEVKGRALEGVGFAYELKALATPAEKDKDLDAALAAFKELENAADVKGFKELAMYHQARVLQNKGDKDKAKEILLSLKERLNKAEEPIGPGIPPPPTFPYLKEVAMDRLHEIDPDAAPKAAPGGRGGPGAGGMPGMPGMPGGAGGKMSQEQIQKLLEQMKKQGGGKPGGH